MLRSGHYITKYITIYIIILFQSYRLCASPEGNQNDRGRIHYNLSLHTGTVLPHNDMLMYLNREYIRSLELNTWFVNTQTETAYNTEFGAGYFYSNLGNKQVFGNVHAAYMSLISPSSGNLLLPDFKLNLGVAYAEKKYDLNENYFNRGIGSHVNMYIQFGITWKIPFVENRWILRPGMSLHHISNGTVVSPNSGINMFTFSAGLDFMSDHSHSGRMVLKRDTVPDKNHRFSVTYASGIKEIDRRIDKKIFTSSLILDYGYMLYREISIGMGIGLFYNDTWAYLPYIRTEKDEDLSPFQAAAHISLQKNIGSLGFFIHPGTYFYMPAKELPFFAGRLGLNYKFENNLTAHFAIKHHWFAIADYFEWGIGYEFNR